MPTRSPETIERAIARLQERIDELETFDVHTVKGHTSPELIGLSTAISSTVDRCFDAGTSAHNRFSRASNLRPFRSGLIPELQAQILERIKQSVAQLRVAQRELREELEDAEPAAQMSVPASTSLSRRVFVVHGHDDGAREAVARFLERIGFEAIILHEQANQGRTVIEKIEAHGDVHFAVVLLTPDDIGCANGGEPEPRARQNVLLELGYFIGRLGRERVCALKRGTLEIPSDFAGVVWEKMDDSGGWKQALGRELEAAGHEVDWNRVMRP
ncbi:TIR domain-containing protein [Paraburkholderia strydomiana]